MIASVCCVLPYQLHEQQSAEALYLTYMLLHEQLLFTADHAAAVPHAPACCVLPYQLHEQQAAESLHLTYMLLHDPCCSQLTMLVHP
jgi:hypothetical protein